jgi:CBS-domain-containing membrane protein
VNNRRCLDEAVRLLKEKSAPAVAVVDASERLVGLAVQTRLASLFKVNRRLAGTQLNRDSGD